MDPELFKHMMERSDAQNLYPSPDLPFPCDAMIPGGRVNPRQMRQAMKRMGIEQEELEGFEEVVISTANKETVIRDPNVTAMTAHGHKIRNAAGDNSGRDG